MYQLLHPPGPHSLSQWLYVGRSDKRRSAAALWLLSSGQRHRLPQQPPLHQQRPEIFPPLWFGPVWERGKELWSWRFGKKFILTCVLTSCVCVTGQSAGYLCGQCNREWERGQRLRLSVHCGSLWHQEPERGVLPSFPYWWLTHWYGLNAAAFCGSKWEDMVVRFGQNQI